jgi:hypothetical protein
MAGSGLALWLFQSLGFKDAKTQLEEIQKLGSHQDFSFDPFGNITKNATVGTSFVPTYKTPINNQYYSVPSCNPPGESEWPARLRESGSRTRGASGDEPGSQRPRCHAEWWANLRRDRQR